MRSVTLPLASATTCIHFHLVESYPNYFLRYMPLTAHIDEKLAFILTLSIAYQTELKRLYAHHEIALDKIVVTR